MKREKLKKLYEMHWEDHPKTGKPRRVYTYVGKRYTLDTAARNAQRPWLIAEAVLAAVLFLAGGLINNLGSRCMYVLPFYVVTLLPTVYFAMGVGRICRMQARITELDMEDGISSAQRSALGLMVLGVLWAVSDLVFIIFHGVADLWLREVLFLLCGVVCALVGWDAGKRLKALPVTEIPQENQE